MLSLLHNRFFHAAIVLHAFLYVPGNVAIQRSLQMNFITSMVGYMLQSNRVQTLYISSKVLRVYYTFRSN